MYKNIHSRLINSLINWQDHSNIVTPYPRPELGVRDGPLFLDSVEFLQLRVNAFELVLQQLPTLVAQLYILYTCKTRRSSSETTWLHRETRSTILSTALTLSAGVRLFSVTSCPMYDSSLENLCKKEEIIHVQCIYPRCFGPVGWVAMANYLGYHTAEVKLLRCQ